MRTLFRVGLGGMRHNRRGRDDQRRDELVSGGTAHWGVSGNLIVRFSPRLCREFNFKYAAGKNRSVVLVVYGDAEAARWTIKRID